MKFKLSDSIEILKRTPSVMETLLAGLSSEWTSNNEGNETWSPYDVVGHLIHGEKTDWIPRVLIILSDGPDKKFEPYDRFAQFRESKGESLPQLLDEFKSLRSENIKILMAQDITEADLSKTGIHPHFGAVTLRQLLSTWVTHDLAHIAQISRVMAKQHKEEMGPWTEYFSIFNN